MLRVVRKEVEFIFHFHEREGNRTDNADEKKGAAKIRRRVQTRGYLIMGTR